eukprot:TRINITY_DN1373_c0_g2_i1.p1 TRINITY_DN1373_c0_g2~~TRINITY_DN1373_c0_g2_i1.p1  ORF type:complete len:627 (+),score=179.98 TRINITY_DN1373_c0_g2_i1:68-1948(+)
MGQSGGKERTSERDPDGPSEVSFSVVSVSSRPFDGQKPGTSGLRKRTRVFMQEHYLENFVQSVFDVIKADPSWPAMSKQALVISGDGRFYNDVAIQTIIKMAVANGVQRIWIGLDGLLSTPAVSAVIRHRDGGGEAFGGFILSASHNPGGIDEDFGIKYNCENGGPSPEKVTNAIAERTKEIRVYNTCSGPDVDIHHTGVTLVDDGAHRMAEVEVFDCTDDHVRILKECFDFDQIRRLVSDPRFTMVYDCMNGVQGPYAKRVFCGELGLSSGCLLHAQSMEDFGGPSSDHRGHADPNLKHAVGLRKAMGLQESGKPLEPRTGSELKYPTFGGAADGDADRNMICGDQFFVSPSDSLAIICANSDLIPQFAEGLQGCARSMPTSGAIDRVAQAKRLAFFEVPTGWKFFGNLMDSGSSYFPSGPNYCPFLCGEESFGTGSSHIREKDGLWAVLAWLQILAAKNGGGDGELVGVRDVCVEHWETYGRNYYARYDYEGVDDRLAKDMMSEMQAMTQDPLERHSTADFTVSKADMFCYEDSVDGSRSDNQGIRWIMADGSRIIFRLSGTGTAGATIRLYLEQYVGPDGDLAQHPADVVKALAVRAMQLSRIPERFGIEVDADGIAKPTVVT